MRLGLIPISWALLLGASLAFAEPGGTVVGGNLNATTRPDHIILTWSDDPATTQTVSFRTAVDVAAGAVVYWPTGKDANEAASQAAAPTPFRTAATDPVQGACLLWTATLTRLEPMTSYSYFVRTDAGRSAAYSFTTGPRAAHPAPFAFLLFGDSQSGDPRTPDYRVWHDTVTATYARHPDARFLMNVGDLVEVGQSIAHWNNWFAAAQDVVARIPEMPVQGNHETYVDVNEKATAKPAYFTSLFRVFANGPEGLGGQTYSFDYGNAHIAILDSQEEEEGKIAGSILPKQAAWLADDLDRSTQTWKLVFFHKTPYYNKATRANELLKSALCPVCESHGVDVVFNGHDHGVSRTYPIKNNRLLSRPSDGTVYYVAGRSGAKTYDDLTRKVWDAFFYDPQDQSCYLTVRIDGPRLTVRAFKADGTPLDRYTIDKKSPSASTITPAPARSNKTRPVVYGDVLPGQALLSKSGSAARDAQGTWFVDAQAFLTYLGGSMSHQGGTTWLFLGGKSHAVPSGQARFNSDQILTISAGAIYDLLGFQSHYDEALNVLFFAK